MKLVIDTCVLFPSVLRGLVLGAAEQGCFTPIWSEKILAEWQHAAVRKDAATGAQASIEIALLKSRWPDVSLPAPTPRDDLFLPDADDVHVLASAIEAGADGILTVNVSDFPGRVLARHGVIRREPDELLTEFAKEKPEAMQSLLAEALVMVQDGGVPNPSLDKLLRRIRLPRLAKWART